MTWFTAWRERRRVARVRAEVERARAEGWVLMDVRPPRFCAMCGAIVPRLPVRWQTQTCSERCRLDMEIAALERELTNG